jgi:hypothetical protein
MRVPPLKIGNQYLYDLNVTQYDHNDYWWNGHPQNAWDFGWGTFGSPENMAASPIFTLDTDLIVQHRVYNNNSQDYIVVEFLFEGNTWRFLLVHTGQFPYKTGDLIKPGNQICTVWYTNATHLHFACELNGKEYPVGELLNAMRNWNTETRPSFKKDDRVQFVADTNIRKSAGTSAELIGLTNGSIAQILSDEKIDSDGFLWQNIKFLDVEGWAYTGNMKITEEPITNVDGTYPVDPEQTCCEKLVEIEKILHSTEQQLKIAKQTGEEYIKSSAEWRSKFEDLEVEHTNKVAELKKEINDLANIKLKNLEDYELSELFPVVLAKILNNLRIKKD